MAARKTKGMKGIVHWLVLDHWVGDGCAEDQAIEAVVARYRCWSEVREGVCRCLDLDLRVSWRAAPAAWGAPALSW